MPHIEAIDLRREGPMRGRFIAPRLAEKIQIAIERKEQALLFLNRRGYAPLTLCRGCGHRFACTICDAWLVDHRFRQRLGRATTAVSRCIARINARIARPRNRWSPSARASSACRRKRRACFRMRAPWCCRAILLRRSMRCARSWPKSQRGRVDVIIGTQLVAKGHNFPRLNLVGVIDADLGLGNGDPRAAERTYQMLNQVIGRAGREQGRGVGYLQTHQPEHPVMKALIANDREAFYASEIEARERAAIRPSVDWRA